LKRRLRLKKITQTQLNRMTEMDLSERLIQAAAETRNIDHSNLMFEARREIGRAEALQAKLDRVMLEYCPDEMTAEQIAEWGKNQVPVSAAEQMALEAALQESDNV
jgi:hypothetical protein